ncbi:MAG: sugar phosphate isomerase/epimerase family protein, partial [Acidobacteriota bacterium]
LVAEVGWDGIECPVRKASTHIAPERVDDDLPRMVEALKKRRLDVAMITTDITGVDPTAEKILRAAVTSGIRNYRLGAMHYTADRPIPAQLEEIKARLRDLAQLNKSLGVVGGIENHSGPDYFGGPIWDAMQVIQPLDPAAIGIAFDIGHATIEGGLAWPLHARLAAPRYTVVYVKDYRWEKTAAGWRPAWCPLGQGMISRKFFSTLAASGYRGPLCQHHEYDLGKTPAEMMTCFKQDLQTFRDWLREAV